MTIAAEPMTRKVIVAPPEMPVGEAAAAWPFVCEPKTDVRDLVRMMVDKKIDAVPVVDAGNHLLGLVTSTDLMLLR